MPCLYMRIRCFQEILNFHEFSGCNIYILADRLLAGARTAILTVQLVTDTWATQLGECHK